MYEQQVPIVDREQLPEMPNSVTLLVKTIGRIAVEYDIEIDDSFDIDAVNLIGSIIAMRNDVEAQNEVILENINAGTNSIVDQTHALQEELDSFLDAMELEGEDRNTFRNMTLTQISAFLARQIDMDETLVASVDDTKEPTKQDLKETETEFEKLSHVPLSEDAQTDYFRKMNQFNLLSASEEVDLAQKIEVGLLAEEKLSYPTTESTAYELRELRTLVRLGARAKEEMFTANLRLVVNYTRKYAHRGMAQLDLIQEGNMGLLHAIERFDYTLGYKFSTYATWWIKQAITRAISDKSSLIRLPVYMNDRISAMMVAKSKIEMELGRNVTDEELGKALDVPKKHVQQLRTYANSIGSLNSPIGEDGTELGDLIPDDRREDPTQRIEVASIAVHMQDILNTFDEQTVNILRLRLGIGYDHPRTLEDVAEIMDMERIDVRKIESRAIKRIRDDESMKDEIQGLR